VYLVSTPIKWLVQSSRLTTIAASNAVRSLIVESGWRGVHSHSILSTWIAVGSNNFCTNGRRASGVSRIMPNRLKHNGMLDSMLWRSRPSSSVPLWDWTSAARDVA